MRRIFASLMLALMAVFAFLPASAGAEGKRQVYVLHVDNWKHIDVSLAQTTERVFQEASADPNAVAVAIIIDTPGGDLRSAERMSSAILKSKVPSVALVSGQAWSAGALIGTSAEKLYMQSGSSIGASEPRDAMTYEPADYKTVSAVVGSFRSAAEARGRDPEIAQAMVDRNARIEGQTTELLTLTASQAVEKQYADGIAADLADALEQAGIEYDQVNDMEATLSEQIGGILTTPWVAILLLITGVVAIGIEFIKPGLGVPGLIGTVALGLFFIGNMLVGTAGWLELGLAMLGVILMVIEVFVPGFGVFGIAGAIAVAASVFMAVPSADLAVKYLAWTSVAFAFVLFGIVRTLGKRGLGRSLTLDRSAQGYVPAKADLSDLVDAEGKALTVLRPAGTAQFGDQKIDVVTEGEYVASGTKVKVIRVEGTRVVVRSAE